MPNKIYNVQLGSYSYKLEVDDAERYGTFNIIRVVDYKNKVLNDTDLFIVSTDVNQELYPVQNNNRLYSTDKTEFVNYDLESSPVYSLNKDAITTKKVRTRRLKIYHPITDTDVPKILHITSYINGIKLHLGLYKVNQLNTASETELKTINSLYNKSYSEYSYVDIPDLDDLLSSWIYDVTLTRFNSLNKQSGFVDKISVIKDNKQFVALNLFEYPYKIVSEQQGDETIYTQQYLKRKHRSPYNITITLLPYRQVDENRYEMDDSIGTGTVVLADTNRFELTSKLGFENGEISIISNFNHSYNKFPDTDAGLLEAYKHHFCVSEAEYEVYSKERVLSDMYADVDAITTVTETDKQQLIDYYVHIKRNNLIYKWILDDNKTLELYKEMRKSVIREEYEAALHTDELFLGYRIEIATDRLYKNIVYSRNENGDLSSLSSFSFPLYNIFKSWKAKPGFLVCRVAFVDRYTGTVINSNDVIITDEWYKYIVTSQKQHIHIQTEMEIQDTSKFKFIDKLNCHIVDPNADADTGVRQPIVNGNLDKQILYKPIFYKVQNLQHINLRPRIEQNIGINLGNYMTKVDLFRISIGGKEYKEIGRNESFVIFKIKAADITDISGVFDIIVDDDTYLSSGTYSINQSI
nr:MAG TPA: hypothetical protein [Caudoviricetes sp.]